MSLFSDNVIPGNHGKLFGTNAIEEKDLMDIKNSLLAMDGIKNVVLNTGIFPREFTVYSTRIMRVSEIENKVKSMGFHAIPQ